MQFVLHLGRNKELAIAELGSILGFESFESLDNNFLLVNYDRYLDQDFLNLIGGTIGIYEVKNVYESKPGSDHAVEAISSDLVNRDKKVNLSFESSLFGRKDKIQILKEVKKNLKTAGVSCRFIEKHSTAALLGSGFMKDKVASYRIVSFEGNFMFGKLVALQDIDRYSLRDYEKPYRDAKLGMHPPKLSQMMLNMAGPAQTVYDPFCGTGTVLMEAMLQHKAVSGSDIKPENVFGTIQNIEWLKDKLGVALLDFNVFQRDAREIENKDLDGVEAIVTEGYLGRPKSKNDRTKDKDLRGEMNQIEDLYFMFFENLASVLKRPISIVINFPIFASKKADIKFENLVEKIKPLGYSVSALLPDLHKLGLEEQETLVYKRSDQRVYREIVKIMYNPG